jgi:hypothetical protein
MAAQFFRANPWWIPHDQVETLAPSKHICEVTLELEPRQFTMLVQPGPIATDLSDMLSHLANLPAQRSVGPSSLAEQVLIACRFSILSQL